MFFGSYAQVLAPTPVHPAPAVIVMGRMAKGDMGTLVRRVGINKDTNLNPT